MAVTLMRFQRTLDLLIFFCARLEQTHSADDNFLAPFHITCFFRSCIKKLWLVQVLISGCKSKAHFQHCLTTKPSLTWVTLISPIIY